MKKQNNNVFELSTVSEINDTLSEILSQGAKKMLAVAIENEVQDFLEKHQEIQDDEGRRLVVRNGYLPERPLQTGLGNIDVKVPRVRDNSGQAIRFRSSLLPPYLKRTKSIEDLLPWLYLKGISSPP